MVDGADWWLMTVVVVMVDGIGRWWCYMVTVDVDSGWW